MRASTNSVDDLTGMLTGEPVGMGWALWGANHVMRVRKLEIVQAAIVRELPLVQGRSPDVRLRIVPGDVDGCAL